jgi:hypothetical protein
MAAELKELRADMRERGGSPKSRGTPNSRKRQGGTPAGAETGRELARAKAQCASLKQVGATDRTGAS